MTTAADAGLPGLSGLPGRPGLPRLQVLPTAADVADAAAAEIARVLAAAVAARGVAHWATTGGSSAPPIYRRLAAPPLLELVPWEHVHTWWGDDRFVPSDHPESNVHSFDQVLLASGGDEAGSGATMSDVGGAGAGARIPVANIHPIPMAAAIAHGGGAAWAAAAYDATLRASGPTAGPGGDPVFDLVILGVGPDGHVLSVFPGSAAWDEPGLCVAVPAPTHIGPHLDRVTIHPRLLATARAVLVITTGVGKAAHLAAGWAGGDVRELPIRATRLPQATWIVDEAAAADLPPDARGVQRA